MPVEHPQTLREMESVKQGISFPRLGALGGFQAEIPGTGEIKLLVTTKMYLLRLQNAQSRTE